MKLPLTKDRAKFVEQAAIDIQQSSKRSILLMCPTLDEASYVDYLNDARRKYGLSIVNFDKKINSLLPIDTAEKFDEFIQIKAHEVMVFSYFAFEHRLDMESDHAWLCLCLATKAGAMLEAILFSKHNLHAFEKGVKSSNAREGSKAKAQKYYAPVIEKTHELAREHCHKQGKKVSKRSVALAIADDVMQFSSKQGLSFSKDQAERTLSKYMKTMQDHDELFR